MSDGVRNPYGGTNDTGLNQSGLLDAIAKALGPPGTRGEDRDRPPRNPMRPRNEARVPGPMEDQQIQDLARALTALGYDVGRWMGNPRQGSFMRSVNQAASDYGVGQMRGPEDIAPEFHARVMKHAAAPPAFRQESRGYYMDPESTGFSQDWVDRFDEEQAQKKRRMAERSRL